MAQKKKSVPKKKVSPKEIVSKKMTDRLVAQQKQHESLSELIMELLVMDSTGINALSKSNPSRDEIKLQVIVVIDAEAARNGASLKKRVLLRAGDESIHLENDLKINKSRREALAIDYSRISMSYSGGKYVGPTAAGRADTLAKAVNLVHKKSKK